LRADHRGIGGGVVLRSDFNDIAADDLEALETVQDRLGLARREAAGFGRAGSRRLGQIARPHRRKCRLALLRDRIISRVQLVAETRRRIFGRGFWLRSAAICVSVTAAIAAVLATADRCGRYSPSSLCEPSRTSSRLTASGLR
jgi:hypothetical protein